MVFESGDEASATQWGLVLIEVAQHTRACAYDRLGVGRSDVTEGCRGMAELRGVLEAMLRAVELAPPYVLAGTSGGGYLIAGFAYAHTEDVVGMVFADTFRAIRPEHAPPELLAEIDCDSFENQEKRDYVAIEHEAWDGRRVLGDFPVAVFTNDYGSTRRTRTKPRASRTSRAGSS